MTGKLRLEYVPIKDGKPCDKGDYLCRLLDNRKLPFYRVLTWYGSSLWSGAVGPYRNVTHWATIPVVCGDAPELDREPGTLFHFRSSSSYMGQV